MQAKFHLIRDFILDHRDIFQGQGCVACGWRSYRGHRLGPFFTPRFRVHGRQSAVYLGRSFELAERVKTLLREIQQERQFARLRRQARAELRKCKERWAEDLAALGLSLKGFEVRGWRGATVAGSPADAGSVDLAMKLRLVAAAGPLGATTILDAGSRAPLSEGEELFRRKLNLSLTFDRAMAMLEGPGYQFRFVQLYADLQMQEKRLKLLESKLAGKCNAALCRHELAEVRAQAGLEREKARAAREARKVEELALRREGQRYSAELEAARERALNLAERKAAEARAAASPLARLSWGSVDGVMDEPSTVPVEREGETDLPTETPVSVPFRVVVPWSEGPVAAARPA